MTRLRARFDGKVLVPVEPVDLPTDRVLELDVRDEAEPPVGSGHAILKALRSPPPLEPDLVDAMARSLIGSPEALHEAITQPPHLSPEDGEALLAEIEKGRIPVRYDKVFDEDGAAEDRSGNAGD